MLVTGTGTELLSDVTDTDKLILAERERRRAVLVKDRRWVDYLKNLPPLIERMENRILVPTDFSPIR